MIRNRLDVYIDGALKFANASLTEQQGQIVVKDRKGEKGRFTDIVRVKVTETDLAYKATDIDGKAVKIVGISRGGCASCGGR